MSTKKEILIIGMINKLELWIPLELLKNDSMLESYKKINEDKIICPITQEEILIGEIVKKLPCPKGLKDNKTKKSIKESFETEHKRAAELIDGSKRSEYLSFKLEGIMESPINICVTYDPTKFGPFVIGRTSIPEAGIYSVCCAIQNLWLAARTEGLGLGWVSILSNSIKLNSLSFSSSNPITPLWPANANCAPNFPDILIKSRSCLLGAALRPK